jgi:magnesium and cobalt transporter
VSADSGPSSPADGSVGDRLRGWLRGLKGERSTDSNARETLNELIDERVEGEAPLDEDELTLLANILDLRDTTVRDIMLPRVDIVAVEQSASLADVVGRMTKHGHSRLAVYREVLDNAIGMVHIKDVLAWRGRDEEFKLRDIVHDVLFVAPSMRILELLLEMRVKRIHMALVVDEHGGIDGLATIEDLVEEIVGDIHDEHDVRRGQPELRQRADGSVDADARASIEALEALLGELATAAERDEIKSLGGLVFSLAGRVPARGQIVTHPAGIEFEILDSDPRRVRRLRVRRPKPTPAEPPSA